MSVRAVCCTVSLGLAVAFCRTATADQVRIAIGRPQIVATNAVVAKSAESRAELWQALVANALGNSPVFAMVEREDLDIVLHELVLHRDGVPGSGKDGASPNKPLLAADCALISQLSVTGQECQVSARLIQVADATMGREFVVSFGSSNVEAVVKRFTRELEQAGLDWLHRRGLQTFVCVPDYENLSPFPRSGWLETAISRRLCRRLEQQPGVLVVEREDLDFLLKETRLKMAGLSKSGEPMTAVGRYLLISGRFDERQPEGAALALRVTTQIQDCQTKAMQKLETEFPATAVETGLQALDVAVCQAVLNPGTVPTTATERLAGGVVGRPAGRRFTFGYRVGGGDCRALSQW